MFQGVASRQQMFPTFDRHVQRPDRRDRDATPLYAGEWFEIPEAEHDYMFEILPPIWIRGSLFAMREFLTGSVTYVFFALRIDEAIRYFHGYCDLSDKVYDEVAAKLPVQLRHLPAPIASVRDLVARGSADAATYGGYRNRRLSLHNPAAAHRRNPGARSCRHHDAARRGFTARACARRCR
ncbi:DUF1419 domain-containing protein (plasmid) [Rhizobium sp. CCGE531]|nr:DUF1419 domain-containing protein [Rhizobium sp. CCGE531]